ncbi:MAG: endonuclease III, partial [bacterium]
MTDKARAKKIISSLEKEFGDVKSPLHHESPFQLLIAVLMSAQSTDNQVNKITPALFKVFPTPERMAKGTVKEIEILINSIGLYKTKAKNIHALSERLVTVYKGKVPDKMEDLITLPGIGRKSANVVLQHCFKKNVGMVVDTHIGRIAVRLGLTKETDSKKAVAIEKDLLKVIPEKDRERFGLYLIYFGRETCGAKKAFCNRCSVAKYCPSA